MPLTDEQESVVRSTSKRLVVNALAGSGKTTTAKAWIKARPGHRVLYLTFNKSAADKMKDDVGKEGLANVHAMTIHSCAYRYLRVGELGRPLQNFTPRELSPVIGAMLSPNSKVWIRGTKLVLDRLASYCRSNIKDPKKFREVIPLPDVARMNCEDMRIKPDKIDDSFVFLWEQALNNPQYSLDHNVYLKYFQLTVPHLPYDAIVVDEAQDLAPVTESIILGGLKPEADLLLLGDTFQQIYSWNGSVNSMSRMIHRHGADVLSLTQSFRCPETVTDKALGFLQILGYEGAFQGMPGPVPLAHDLDAWLFRTNSGVFEKLLEISDINNGDFSHIYLVGGAAGYNLHEIADTARLKQGHIPKNPHLAGFISFDGYEAYCRDAQDYQGIICCKLIRKYGEDAILHHYEKIQSSHFAPSPGEADIAISTAHKSKGQEFSRVHLGSDFFNLKTEWANFLCKQKRGQTDTPPAGKLSLSDKLESLLESHYSPDVKRKISLLDLVGKKAVIRSGTFIPRVPSIPSPPENRPSLSEEKTFFINAEEFRLLYVAITRAAATVSGDEAFQVSPTLWREIFTSGNDAQFVELDQYGNWIPYQSPLGGRIGDEKLNAMSVPETL